MAQGEELIRQHGVATIFANGKVTAKSGLYGSDFEAALKRGETYVPYIGGRGVHCKDNPFGFATKEEAIAKGNEVKINSKKWLVENSI